VTERICVSRKNTKIGATMSVSLPPGTSCPTGVPCLRGCYAKRLTYSRPSMRESWERNWRILQGDIVDYFKQIEANLSVYYPPFFRWHVAGDIPSIAYFCRMVDLAENFKGIAFACYTKTDFPKHYRSRHKIPENLAILRSVWLGFDPMPRTTFKKAQFVPRGEKIPTGGFVCPRSCVGCRECWAPRGTVYFNQH
jgi:hypothetical protein